MRISSRVILSLAMVATSIAFTDRVFAELPQGTYEGIGEYEDGAGLSGHYLVRTQVEAKNRLRSEYVWLDGSRTWNIELKADAKGKVDVIDLDQVKSVGQGYCNENSCKYQVTVDKEGKESVFEESVTFAGRYLLRMGKKPTPGGEIIYFEKLPQR